MTGIADLLWDWLTLPQHTCGVNYSGSGGQQVPIVGIRLDEVSDEPAGRHDAATGVTHPVENLADEKRAETLAAPLRVDFGVRQDDSLPGSLVAGHGVVRERHDVVALEQLEPGPGFVVTELHDRSVPAADTGRTGQTAP